jgi:hypothetical protein
VSPSLPVARRALLERFNVHWIPMTQEEFALKVLAGLDEERQAGHQRIALQTTGEPEEPIFQSVGDLRMEAVREDAAEYLLGRSPMWSDLTNGYAVVRTFEEALLDDVAKHGTQILILTSTSGAGKSTTLMRLALRYQTEGRDVLWLKPDSFAPLHQLLRIVRDRHPDVLAVDDVDRFRESAGRFLAEAARDNPDLLVIASARSTRYERYRLDEAIGELRWEQLTVPHLGDDDIELLIGALEKANRLGWLRGRSHQEQVVVT